MLEANPTIFQVGENGFAMPNSGGTIGVLGGVVTFENDSVSKDLGLIPDNAVPVMLMVSVTEDFDSGTSDVLDIGLTSDADYFADDLDIADAGNFLPNDTGMIAGRYGVKLGSGEQLTALYVSDGTAPSQGSVNVLLFYYLAGEVVNLD